jgi:ribosome modulation factor
VVEIEQALVAQMEWTLDTLNKAYQQGYMTGLAGQESAQCPYSNDILIAA